MADEIKKTTDEVKENTANTPEGAIPDDAAETVVGGFKPTNIPNWQRTTDIVKNGNDNNR